MPLKLLTSINPIGSITAIRKHLLLLSFATLIFKCIENTINSPEDLTLTFPLWFLPQKNIFSFLIGYFFTHGVGITLGIIFWIVSFLLLNYLIKLTSWKEEFELSLLKAEQKEAEFFAELICKISASYQELNSDKKLNDIVNSIADKEDRLREKYKKANKHNHRVVLFLPLILFFYAVIISCPEGMALITNSWSF